MYFLLYVVLIKTRHKGKASKKVPKTEECGSCFLPRMSTSAPRGAFFFLRPIRMRRRCLEKKKGSVLEDLSTAHAHSQTKESHSYGLSGQIPSPISRRFLENWRSVL
ncbi:hypothetical protein AVEN_106645-1 [Araneus ventricosus]|uniref:Uncharacterized protein n=1 Tax=Araneus ventricosus TaxID=182803 RepID=A0A4Y2VL05_ARAVE|nr:hypothetical protein AVEN_106645-1 [Araneus ventricosus]